jgi:RNA polymerase sigma-70 factor (ECF subfamily)
LSSEAELIRRAQAGETDAFCLLAQAYERRIYSLAFHYCRDCQDAEDLSQEVWLKVYAALATFRNESTFYTWLRKITINCFLNHRRRRAKSFPWSRQTTDDVSSGDYPIKQEGEPIASLEIRLQNQLVVEKVMQALSSVTPQQRLIFLLKHQEGMTYEEISKALDCSPGTVKKSVSRTIAKLREQLGVNEESENYISCAATGILR